MSGCFRACPLDNGMSMIGSEAAIVANLAANGGG